MNKETQVGYKGFDKNLKCRDMQYEVGKEYNLEEGKNLACCPNGPNEGGLHYCEHPLDVFGYYPPASSRFCEVENKGETKRKCDDTKVASSRLFIKAEISFKALIEGAVKFVFDRADWSKKESHATGNNGAASATGYNGAASATGNNGAASATGNNGAASATGNNGAASATGYRGAASATGYNGAASATGNNGAASATGKDGTAIALGPEGKAKGIIGNYIVLAEWKQNSDFAWTRKSVKVFLVDGKKIKEDVYYRLKNGKAIKA